MSEIPEQEFSVDAAVQRPRIILNLKLERFSNQYSAIGPIWLTLDEAIATRDALTKGITEAVQLA